MTGKHFTFGFCDRCIQLEIKKKVPLRFHEGRTIVECPRCGRHIYGHPAKNEK